MIGRIVGVAVDHGWRIAIDGWRCVVAETGDRRCIIDRGRSIIASEWSRVVAIGTTSANAPVASGGCVAESEDAECES
jgi:hypothetical protein